MVVNVSAGGNALNTAPGGTFTRTFATARNIPESSPGMSVSRTFPNAGDYDYYSSKNREVKGRIRVR